MAIGGLVASDGWATWRAGPGPGAEGFEGAAGGTGICTVVFFAAVVVFAGKDALIILDEASTAVVGSVGTLWGTEPSAFGAGVRRALRGRPEAGDGLPALGGFAILGFTPLFRHINEIRRDCGAILPSAWRKPSVLFGKDVKVAQPWSESPPIRLAFAWIDAGLRRRGSARFVLDHGGRYSHCDGRAARRRPPAAGDPCALSGGP